MDDIKQITFMGDHQDCVSPADEFAHKWYQSNKNKIKVLSGIYNVELSKELTPDFHNTIVLRYTGDSSSNPQTCQHLHVKHVTTPPTCFSEGIIINTCIDCGTVLEPTTISIVDHNYSYVPNHDETCINDGTKTGTCSYCGKQIIVPYPGSALGHNYTYHSDNNATCTEDGTETAVCTHCHESNTRPDPGSAYGHNYTWTPDNNATCIQDGTETGRCYHGDDQITRPLPGSALGHSLPTSWSIRVLATCLTSGIEFRKCIRCSYEETRPIPQLQHAWISNENGTHKCATPGGCGVDNETCSPNSYGQYCAKCGYHTPEDITFVITTDYINGMTVGNPFSQYITTNISSGVDWDIVSGIIPPGIIFYRTGELRGTPSRAGIYNFSLKAIYRGQIVTKEFSVNVSNIMYTVTFDGNGGNSSEVSRTIAQGSTIGTLPTATRNGFDFAGWYTSIDSGLKIDTTYTVSSNVTLYARWGQGSDVEFGDVTTQFNIQYKGDRTNFDNNPYTIYYRIANGDNGYADLAVQTGISSNNNTNNMDENNRTIIMYMKVTNNGSAGNFDIGFDCDSYVAGNDKIIVNRISKGVQLGSYYTVTVPYDTIVWVGKYDQRTRNRYKNIDAGQATSGNEDSGYAFTMKNIFINSGSYTILEVTFQMK